ncbi:MAG TPA: F0F1 ATP synthase subunit beta, partial [Candidatus Saccharibacteria bacterium]|nr:F0F1 ATP synthase subunit beta [Candidatus Saccharibacteria bacterium]
YVPADDFTDPAVQTIMGNLEASVILSRELAEKRIYPAIDPLRSTSLLIDAKYISSSHFQAVRGARKILERYNNLKTIIAILGVDELSEEDKVTVDKAKKLIKFFTQPFFTSQDYSGIKGAYVPLEDTVKGVRKILNGEFSQIPDDYFYMIGKIEEVEEKWRNDGSRPKS